MRFTKSTTVLALLLSLIVAASSFGAENFGDITWFDLSDWDSDLIDNGPGQTFDLGNGESVTVKGYGDFTAPSEWTANNFIQSTQKYADDRNQFHFTFDTSLPVVFHAATVDPDEHVQVLGVGPETYCHSGGLAPTQSTITSGLQLEGNGYGSDASNGIVMTYAQRNQAVILRHDSLANNKYEFFRVGTIAAPVPEPNAAGLIGIGALGLVLSRRKRRNG